MGLDVEEGRNVRTKRKRLERSFIWFQILRLQCTNCRISRWGRWGSLGYVSEMGHMSRARC